MREIHVGRLIDHVHLRASDLAAGGFRGLRGDPRLIQAT
jgi:hypothetical protein